MSAIKVQLPTALESRIGVRGDQHLQAHSIAEAIDHLKQQIPTLDNVLFTPHGRLRGFINLYLNDTDIRDLDGLQTQLQDGDCLAIVPAVAGG